MNYLMNHCFCRDSIWGGQYNCRVIVSIEMIAKDKTYYDPHESDWINLIEEVPYDNGKEIPFKKYSTRRLKPEVVQWLNDNVKDRTLLKWQIEKGEHKQGWAIGTDEYNSGDGLSFTVFFESSRDAMKFIKRWSSYKNAVDYLNYFKDIRRELNPNTGRLKRVPRWTNTP